jgi:hypothetical protein
MTVSVGVHSFSSDPMARFAIVAIALLLLWRIVEVNVVDYERSGRPRLAAPTSAMDLPSRDRKAFEKAALQRIVGDNPAEVAAILMLARQFEAEGEMARAEQGYRSALELAPLEREVLALSAAHFLRKDDPLGVDILARLVANYPEARGRVFPILAGMLALDRYRQALSEVISRNPTWLSAFIVDACNRVDDPAILMPVMLRLSASGKVAPSQAACVIERLRAAGRWEQAYHLWLNFLPRDRRRSVGFVFNGSFEFPPGGDGFDWIVQEHPAKESGHAVAILQTQNEAGKRALHVAYNGNRQSGIPVRQFLVLPPGQYELTGLARPDGIKAARGIHWTVRCVEQADSRKIIASSERFVGSSEWRRFAMDLKIDKSCSGHVLQLEPVAEDGAAAFVAGMAWFDDLRLRRR